MALIRTVKNIWKCDICGLEKEQDINPFFKIIVRIADPVDACNCEIDACRSCIDIKEKSVIEYVESIV